MSLDSQPSMPRRSEAILTPEDNAKKQIEATLAELDAQFGSADVNQALQVIFVGDETLTATPKSLSYLRWKLEVLNAEIGEDIVSAALYDADKKRNPPIEAAPEPIRNDPGFIRSSDEYVAEMITLLSGLEDTHPDAFELWGGDDERIHLDELPIYGTEAQTDELHTDLESLREFNRVARDTDMSSEERLLKLKEIRTQHGL